MILFRVFILACLVSFSVHARAKEIKWESWTDDIFTRAKKDHKLVILDLQAVWCHWCHVMEIKTYQNPEIIDEITEHFIAVRVDQDSRPDLANRYENYGWPATIIFNDAGLELAKRSGFIPPEDLIKTLKAFVADPTPGPSGGAEEDAHYSKTSKLTDLQKESFAKLIKDNYDWKLGGWKTEHKYLDASLAEYNLRLSEDGDKKASENLTLSLKSQHALLDPVWGGVYQYSAEGDWKHPHFEKIMSIQSDNLKIYSLATRDPNTKPAQMKMDLDTAKKIADYVAQFLTSPEGAFYTSQDADAVPGEHGEKYFALNDKMRRQKGIPKVDQDIYARENGWMISALLDYYMATADSKQLDKAVKAANWINANRRIGADGLFRHDQIDKAGPYFGDSVAMGTAFLKLYFSTGDRKWLVQAEGVGKLMKLKFFDEHAFLTVPGPISSNTSSFKPKPQFDENILAFHFYNLLSFYTGKKDYRTIAETLFGYLSSPDFSQNIYSAAAILIANDELSAPPLHIVVVGEKSDAKAQKLFETGLQFPNLYKVLEWWDKREGPMPNPEVTYPQLTQSAAFVCAQSRCSFPAFKPEEIALRVQQLSGKPKPK